MTTTLAAAKEYVQRGWSTIPVPKREKAPTHSGWQNLRLKESDLKQYFSNGSNIGVLTGEASGDLVDVDLDCEEALTIADRYLPETQLISGRRSNPRSHRWFKCSFNAVRSFAGKDGKKLVELRGKGGQTILPPSIHPSGEQYEWASRGEPAKIEEVEILVKAVKLVASAALLARHWPAEGSRHDASLSLCGLLLRDRGWTDDTTQKFQQAVLEAARDEERRTRRSDVRTTAQKLQSGQPVTGGPELAKLVGEDVVERVREWLGLVRATTCDLYASPTTASGNAERLIEFHGDDLLWLNETQSFLVWDDVRWKRDARDEAREMTRKTMIELYVAAATRQDNQFTKWYHASQNTKALSDTMREARGRLTVLPEELDGNEWLLNFKNCTVDLKTGAQLKHQREHRITKLVPYDHNPKATCPTFTMFMLETFGKDQMRAVLRALGYSLTGITRDKAIFFLHGAKNSGKTTLLALVKKLIGDYATQINVESLMTKQQDSNTQDDLAKLRGARFAISNEIGVGQRLMGRRLKALTQGQGQITAARKYEHSIEFDETHKLWIDTNHKPLFDEQDDALASRIFPFGTLGVARLIDRELPEKLEAEAEGILSLLVDEARQWAEGGLIIPEVMERTKAEWNEDEPFDSFVAEETDQSDKAAWTSINELFARWKLYCEKNGERAGGSNVMGNWLSDRGILAKKKNNGRGRLGIRLRSDTALAREEQASLFREARDMKR